MNKEAHIDLHTHSTCSDGTWTPTQLVEEAERLGLRALALTDHDTVSGIPEALLAKEGKQVEVIGGIELAAYYHFPWAAGEKVEIHIVGLWVDHTNKALLAATKDFGLHRQRRNQQMTALLTSLGFPMTYEELLEEAGTDNCTRAHYARLMVKKGYVADKKEAFATYIGHGKPGFVPRDLPDPATCIDLIHQSGGVAVLAHSTLYGLNYGQITQMAEELKALGLDAMEVRYSTYRAEQEREITKIAQSLGLAFSGGSDFHGDNKPDISLGIGRGHLAVPESFLEPLRSRRPQKG